MTQDIFLIQETQKRLFPCKHCGSDPKFVIYEGMTPRSEPYVQAWIDCGACRVRVLARTVDIVNVLRPPELLKAIDQIVDIWNNGNLSCPDCPLDDSQ